MMAVTQTKYFVPVHLSEPTPYPLRCRHNFSGKRISSSYDSSCFIARDNLQSSNHRYHDLCVNSNLPSQTNDNSALPSQELADTLSTEIFSLKNMTSHNHHSSESRVISNDVKSKQRSKSMGNFASSLAKSRRRRSSDSHNNNTNRGGCTNIKNERNSTLHAVEATPEMTSTDSSDHHNSDESRVPVNGEATPDVSEPTSAVEVSSQAAPGTSAPLPIRRNSCISSRKNSLISSTGIGNLNPYDPKYREFMIGSEPWKDDSLSLSSSFSSSLSSLPSPPSPASPPTYRPQSLPQTADIVLSDTELLSSSLPDTAFYSTSCGGSPRKKRVKDSEGFIRRAACVCLNEAETEVLLVSSKSSSEVWLVPGGGLEEGEEAQQAALREAYEEAGVRGSILAYLGLFESRPELTSSGKKHRTAVYVVRVLEEEHDFPEALTLGRQTKWMTVDDALAQLSRHRPRQSVYLQLLRATRLNVRSGDSSTTSSDTTSASVNQATKQPTTVVTGGEANRRKESVIGDESQLAGGSVCNKGRPANPSAPLLSRNPEGNVADDLGRLKEVQESQFEQEDEEREMPSDLQLMASQLSELRLKTPNNTTERELDLVSPASTSSESLIAVRKNSSDLRSDVTLGSGSSSGNDGQETDDGEEMTTKEGDEEHFEDHKVPLNDETQGNSEKEPLAVAEGAEEGS